MSKGIKQPNGRYRYPSIREADIQKSILDWLRLRRIFHYRQNVGVLKTANRFVRFGVKGLPDIICVIKGQYVGLEVKREGKELSCAQVEFAVDLQRAGGRYHVVHSLAEAQEALK